MNDGSAAEPALLLQRLQVEDAIGQLRRQEGLMAILGREGEVLKLDWVEAVARILADPTALESVEDEARALWQQGIRHIIWAGMGGSVITVRVLAGLGFCSGQRGEHIAIYPLDSTDPAALNSIIQQIAQAKKQLPPAPDAPLDPDALRAFLGDVMMVGVAMGMTSEEPITHLSWFVELLEQAQLAPAEHLLVMTLPDSYLDRFAHERQASSRPLQLDSGTGTSGRMSAPATRVFLFPVALYLTRLSDAPGQLRTVMQQAWQNHNLDLATSDPAAHPFVQLAATLSAASTDSACRLLLDLPTPWRAIRIWIEQLMEESLGKGGKGVIIFHEQPLDPQAAAFRRSGTLHVRVSTTLEIAVAEQQASLFHLPQPYLATSDPHEQLAALATSFLGWQLTMAVYGYLHRITFAGQPAVENYKSRARALRSLSDPLEAVRDWQSTFSARPLSLLAPSSVEPAHLPASIFAQVLKRAAALSDEDNRLGYLDFTINGEVPSNLKQIIADYLHHIGNTLLGVPIKLRQAPADYHSTEQSEMDGPPCLVSLRLLLRHHEHVLLGTYTDAFLLAQAVSTWQAMLEQDRLCFLLLIDGTPEQASQPLQHFFADVASRLHIK